MNVGSVGADVVPPGSGADLRTVAGGFEALFLGLLMKSMRKTVPSSPLFSGGQGGAIFTQMMDRATSEFAVRRGGGIGIASMILERYGRASGAGETSTSRISIDA